MEQPPCRCRASGWPEDPEQTQLCALSVPGIHSNLVESMVGNEALAPWAPRTFPGAFQIVWPAPAARKPGDVVFGLAAKHRAKLFSSKKTSILSSSAQPNASIEQLGGQHGSMESAPHKWEASRAHSKGRTSMAHCETSRTLSHRRSWCKSKQI